MLTVSQTMTLHGLIATKDRARAQADEYRYSEKQKPDLRELEHLLDAAWLADQALVAYVDSLVVKPAIVMETD